MDTVERKAYTVPDTARVLGVSVDTVYELVRANQIPHKRLGRRIIIPI
ncbi:MAG: helix-turn-helix domain-containing protein [Deinococcota bacterium]